jgi:hypothetical protein
MNCVRKGKGRVGGSPGADTGGPEVKEGSGNSIRGSDERCVG